ncbi:hypothetical protein B0H12DRAFT_597590 [Mycena haematopus]|nr:hypothetical protein B0H12DRAFT_597590 [Mycena haematopus]
MQANSGAATIRETSAIAPQSLKSSSDNKLERGWPRAMARQRLRLTDNSSERTVARDRLSEIWVSLMRRYLRQLRKT